MSLTTRVKELCKNKGMSLQMLEAEVGLGINTIYKWDKAYPSADKLQKVADYFEVSTDYLLGRTVGEDNQPYNTDQLDNVYFRFAKEAQNSGIDPEDIKMALETIKKIRGI